jgi:hypothetical protein
MLPWYEPSGDLARSGVLFGPGTPIPSQAPTTYGEEDRESQNDDADQHSPFPMAITPPTAKKNATTSRPIPPNRAAISMAGEASPTTVARSIGDLGEGATSPYSATFTERGDRTGIPFAQP